jgi:O-antigen ligase
MDWLMNRLLMKLPFLLMPFAIVAIPRFDKKVYYPILAVFFWLTTVICIYSIALYVLDYEVMTEAYKQGHVLFTPVMHIRFSLLVVYSIVIGYWLFGEKYHFKFLGERWLLLAATTFLLVYIHILAVRSGLVSLYAVFFYGIIYFIIKQKRYVLGTALFFIMIAGSFAAIRFVPTLWNKVNYMRWSLEQFARGERLADLSDSYRLATIEAGITLGNQNPILGVGFGDIKDETKAYLEQKYPTLLQQIYMPQSEYVLFYAATGIVGLLLFTWITLQPFFYQKAWQHLLIGGFHVIMIVSFIVEQTLGNAIGDGDLCGVCDFRESVT